jgi:hypothetical protein
MARSVSMDYSAGDLAALNVRGGRTGQSID